METHKGIRIKKKKWKKKWLTFKKKKLKTAIDNNEVKNNTKSDKVFSNYKIDNVTRVGVVDNQLERERSVDGKIQRTKKPRRNIKIG